MDNINKIIKYAANNKSGWIYVLTTTITITPQINYSTENKYLFVSHNGEILSVHPYSAECADFDEDEMFIFTDSPVSTDDINEFVKLLESYSNNSEILKTLDAINNFNKTYDFSSLDIPDLSEKSQKRRLPNIYVKNSHEDSVNETKKPIYRGCPNGGGSCYCTGVCREIIGYE